MNRSKKAASTPAISTWVFINSLLLSFLLIGFVLWHINRCGLFKANANLAEEEQQYNSTHSKEG